MSHERARLPSFFVIGAAKSGTTTVAEHLARHPGVFMAHPKEPNYFALAGRPLPPGLGPAPDEELVQRLYRWSVTDMATYQERFSDAGESDVVGEASVIYLYHPEAAERIAAAVPEARLIVILRHPVDRMYSHFHMNRQHGLEPLTFSRALAAEDQRVEAGWGWDWHYVRMGRYGQQLAVWLAHFRPEQLMVHFTNDLARDPTATMRAIFEHLGVDADHPIDPAVRAKASRDVRSVRWQYWSTSAPLAARISRFVPGNAWPRLAARSRRLNERPPAVLDASARAELSALFVEDIRRLESLLGRPTPW